MLTIFYTYNQFEPFYVARIINRQFRRKHRRDGETGRSEAADDSDVGVGDAGVFSRGCKPEMSSSNAGGSEYANELAMRYK